LILVLLVVAAYTCSTPAI